MSADHANSEVTVLYIDDIPEPYIGLIRDLILPTKCKFITLSNSKEGLDELMSMDLNQIHLVICNLMNQKNNLKYGPLFITNIRNRDRKIPIIVLTGIDPETDPNYRFRDLVNELYGKLNVRFIAFKGAAFDPTGFREIFLDAIGEDGRGRPDEDRSNEKPILLLSALYEERDALIGEIRVSSPMVEKLLEDRNVKLSHKSRAEKVAYVYSFGKTANQTSNEVTKKLIGELKPGLVILFGIAAGIRKRVALGDVVVTNRIVDLRICKIGETYEFEPNIIAPKKAIALPFDKAQLEEQIRADTNTKFNILVDMVCGSSDNLIRKLDYMNSASKTHRKLSAMEMEAAGVAEACNEHNVPFYIVKAITDFGDELKDDSYHQIATILSSKVVVHGFLNTWSESDSLGNSF